MIIGITGGIGSGKSTIAKELAYRGFGIYNCDKRAKEIIAEESIVQFRIKRLLGKKAYKDNHYNIPYVSKRVFAEPELLQALNELIHPWVYKDLQDIKIFRDSRGATDKLFVESAVFKESGLDKLCDKIVIVDAPVETRIRRVLDRDYYGKNSALNIERIRARMNAQKDSLTDLHCPTIRVTNDGSLEIKDIVDQILSQL
ncbi:MAG: dephospho-CoA kinase [Paludibacteraceae bacterium]|nr:dephospho-CoA kinase [Paludibacteraceae bacterium]